MRDGLTANVPAQVLNHTADDFVKARVTDGLIDREPLSVGPGTHDINPKYSCGTRETCEKSAKCKTVLRLKLGRPKVGVRISEHFSLPFGLQAMPVVRSAVSDGKITTMPGLFMNAYYVVRSSCLSGLFLFGLLDGLSVRLRWPHLREAPAGFGLECSGRHS